MDADLIIVGCGIAGLRCGLTYLHKRPSAKVVILEKYNYIGGRIVTFHKDLENLQGKCEHLQWENGAGRISTHHKKTLSLIERYSLTTFPLDDKMLYENNGMITLNVFNGMLKLLLPQILRLSPETLATHTLKQLFQEILGESETEKLCLEFPYRAEVDTLRADLAMKSFHGEMGTYEGYVVVKEGYQAIPKAMAKEFQDKGGQILFNQEVVDIEQQEKILVRTRTDAGDVLWAAPYVILALHSDAMKAIPLFRDHPILEHLRMEPLVRFYAVFPTEKGTSWFSDLPKLASSSPVRFFIPMNPSCGTAMISYTDGKDARKILQWLDTLGEEKTGEKIVSYLREMFPSKDIPDPLFFKAHPWTSGCTYWLPGLYNPMEESKKMMRPLSAISGLYCCGESFSLRQAWVEGALEHADQLMEMLLS